MKRRYAGSEAGTVTLFFVIATQIFGLNGATIDVSTGTSPNWRVTAGGAVNALPYPFGTEISVTSTGTGAGSFVSGGTFANFSGFWLGNYSFFLPADATAVSLTFSNLYADDRVVLTLNGNVLASTGLPYSGNDSSGSMVLTDGGALQPWSFTGSAGSVSGVVTNGFNVGGMNLLQGIVNNTDAGVYGPDLPIYEGTSNDGTHFGLAGVISYSEVPEPPTLALLVTALSYLAYRRKSVRSSAVCLSDPNEGAQG
jgi:hypothetical protein